MAIICEARFGGGATWNRDGVIVFAPAVDSALFRVAATGGTPTPVTALDPAHRESGHVGPLFLPDGRHFVFGIVGGDSAGHYVASLDSPERKRISLDLDLAMLGFGSPDFLFFMRDRTLMAQRFDLKRLDVTGEPIRVAEGVDRLGLTRHLRASLRVARWCTGQVTRSSHNRRGSNATAPRRARWDRPAPT